MAIPKILDHERKLKNIQDGPEEFSIKEGYNTTASGYSSHAEGQETTASGENAHAEGCNTVASGDYGSHAEGCDAIASGEDAHAEGYHTVASANESHAEGYFTTASGDGSHAEGNRTTASGSYSHAEGLETEAFGHTSHAEGYQTKSQGAYGSHSEGYKTIADGEYGSHAEGCVTDAAGKSAHAEGYLTISSGLASHAEGLGTIANSRAQHVQGAFNILDTENPEDRGTYAHIIGNGAHEEIRSNAHTLDWNGNAWFAGNVYVGSDSGTNKDDGSKKLATEEYVDNNGGIFWATSETTFDELWDAWNMGKLLCISPVGNGLGLSDTYVCDGIINYDSGNNDRIFSFSPASPTSSMSLVGGGYTLWCSQIDGWDSGASIFTPNTTTVYSTLKRKSTAAVTPLSASDAYYRPIYTSTQEPTASDGKVGDIWIVYTE